jgi:hypothetical protein
VGISYHNLPLHPHCYPVRVHSAPIFAVVTTTVIGMIATAVATSIVRAASVAAIATAIFVIKVRCYLVTFVSFPVKHHMNDLQLSLLHSLE